jgi:hypothetical protein
MQLERFTHQSEPEEGLSGRCLILLAGQLLPIKNTGYKNSAYYDSGLISAFYRQHGNKTALRNNPPASGLSPEILPFNICQARVKVLWQQVTLFLHPLILSNN